MLDGDISPKLSNDLKAATKDLVPFRFEIYRYDDTDLIFQTKPGASSNTKKKFPPNLNDRSKGMNHIIAFRAFLDKIGDNFKASHNKYKYNGRAENFYTYASFDRKITLGFKIAAK